MNTRMHRQMGRFKGLLGRGLVVLLIGALLWAAWGRALAVEAAPEAVLQGCSGFPIISSFSANPPVIAPGQVSTLAWGLVANANYAALVTPGGTPGRGPPGQ